MYFSVDWLAQMIGVAVLSILMFVIGIGIVINSIWALISLFWPSCEPNIFPTRFRARFIPEERREILIVFRKTPSIGQANPHLSIGNNLRKRLQRIGIRCDLREEAESVGWPEFPFKMDFEFNQAYMKSLKSPAHKAVAVISLHLIITRTDRSKEPFPPTLFFHDLFCDSEVDSYFDTHLSSTENFDEDVMLRQIIVSLLQSRKD